MITRDFIDTLHCPGCGSSFEIELQHATEPGGTGIAYGILRCACYRYPIVDGIPILRQRSGPADTTDRCVTYIEAGDCKAALHYAFYYDSPVATPTSRWRKAAGKLGLAGSPSQADLTDLNHSFRDVLKLHRPASYANYLFHRNANNSFLAAIPLLLLLNQLTSGSQDASGPPPRMLDLNCGVGHASFLAGALIPGLFRVATDHDFVNLYLARHYMVPGVPCLCLDAEQPLPFKNRFFDAVLCLDGLHYIRSKRAIVKELDRCISEAGLWLFPHMHNVLQRNASPGVAMRPADYQRCFDFLPNCLQDESDIFKNFMGTHCLDLSERRPAEDLNSAAVISLVATRNPSLWRRHENLDRCLRSPAANLAPNPIYRCQENGTGVSLRMQWPTRALEEECAPVKAFLPQSCEIESGLWRGLRDQNLDEAGQSRVVELMKSFVVVPLPRNYT